MDDLSLQCLYQAWQQARAGKKPSHNQLIFESRWLDNLFALQESLQQGSWRPKPAVCFITTHPKCREIHAPDFADRVVHHWLVPQLEALYEPVFIHDSHANRKQHGTHLAVQRLQGFMRQAVDGQCRKEQQGYALQLDIRNFFNRIHRPTLYRLLKQRLAKAQQQGKITPDKAFSLQWLCHRLLAQHPSKGVYYRDDASVRALVPAHKQLANAPKDCGLPIGNLTSQFFANVLLNELDQFIKHRLKCRHYVRYVDDFVLLYPDSGRLQQWQQAIESFLASHLKLAAFARVHYRHGRLVTSPTAQQALHAQLMSYLGHATHANGHRTLWRQWLTAYPWLSQRYVTNSDRPVLKTIPPKNTRFKQQWHWWRAVCETYLPTLPTEKPKCV